MGFVDLSWALPWVCSQLENQLGQIRPLFTQSLPLLGLFSWYLQNSKNNKKASPKAEVLYDLCFCHMYHCSIGQNKSVDQTESLCGRKLPKCVDARRCEPMGPLPGSTHCPYSPQIWSFLKSWSLAPSTS